MRLTSKSAPEFPFIIHAKTFVSSQSQFKGFPAKISSKAELVDIVKRIVFIPAQHHAMNYPVAYYGAFVPNMPTKLYDDPRVPPEEFGFHSLPQAHLATVSYIELYMCSNGCFGGMGDN